MYGLEMGRSVPVKQSDFMCAVIVALRNDSTLASFVNNRIYTQVPQEDPTIPFPYIKCSLLQQGDWSTKTDYGYNGILQCDVWSNYKGNIQVLQIMEAIHDVLHRKPLLLASGQNVCLNFDISDQLTEQGTQIMHGVSRFRALLSE